MYHNLPLRSTSPSSGQTHGHPGDRKESLKSELKEGVGKVGQAYVRGIAKRASKADRYLRVSGGGQLVSGIFEPSIPPT